MNQLMLKRALNIATHVISQVTGRWFHPSIISAESFDLFQGFAESNFNLGDLDVEDWNNFLSIYQIHNYLGSHRPSVVDKILRNQRSELARLIHQFVSDSRHIGAELITIDDPHYPPLLRFISDPPIVLTALGNIVRLIATCDAIVGSRQASELAMRESFELGKRLNALGIVAVSGGAIGCDIAAHQGVLSFGSNQARAIVVFAGGLANLYPRANSSWFAKLLDHGAAFVSERLIFAPCRRWDFVSRNRIIAGISRRVYVMQAALKSGAMLTSRLALDQGRDVVVLSHPPGDVRALGGASLIADGARSVLDAKDAISHEFLI